MEVVSRFLSLDFERIVVNFLPATLFYVIDNPTHAGSDVFTGKIGIQSIDDIIGRELDTVTPVDTFFKRNSKLGVFVVEHFSRPGSQFPVGLAGPGIRLPEPSLAKLSKSTPARIGQHRIHITRVCGLSVECLEDQGLVARGANVEIR